MRYVVTLLDGGRGRRLLLFTLLRHGGCERASVAWQSKDEGDDKWEVSKEPKERTSLEKRVQEKKGAIMIRLGEWDRGS